MASKFEKGLSFQYPIYVQGMATPLTFADLPGCEIIAQQWTERFELRNSLSEEERVKDIAENGYFSVSPREVYSRSCKCATCRSAFMATFFKGLLTRPRKWWDPTERDPNFTREGMQKKFMELLGVAEAKLSTSDKANVNKAKEALKNDESGAYMFSLNRTNFSSVAFVLVQALWTKSVQEGSYYGVPTDKSFTTKHPQPSWSFLTSIDEVATLQRDLILSEEVLSRRLLLVSCHGPLTEAQAMLVFGPIRSIVSKGGVVAVNSDDPTLRDYILRLQRNME
jgi:hypothetical protein